MDKTQENDISSKVADLKKKLAEERKKNSITSSILEGGTLIMWAVNIDLELISFNQNYFRNFLNNNPNTIIWELDDDTLVRNIQKEFWKPKYQEALSGKSIHFTIKTNINGQMAWKEVFLNPIFETSGEVTGVSGLAHDITEKMDSKMALVESEKMFRNIFESFQDLYFRCDFSGKILMLSPSVEEISGYSERELLGKNVADYYLYKTKTKSLLRKLVARSSVRNFQVDIVNKDGNIVHCICNVRLINNEQDMPLFIEGVARDISELKRVNEKMIEAKEFAEKSLKIKERFLANMSHEIRTPLNGIIGMIHLLDQPNLDEQQQKRVKSLQHSSEILLNILNDLLDLSKLEAGKVELRKQPISTQDLIKKLLYLYNEQANSTGVSISYTIDPKIPDYIFSDETKLLQVMANLVSNAIKFSHENDRVTIDLQLLEKDLSGKLKISCKVTDTGIGISSKDKEHLFTSFTQLDSSSKKAYKGTGLGLYISKQLSKLFNGDIKVESTLNKGSVFQFVFEASTTRIRPEKKLDKKKVKAKISGKPKILVVDDNQVNLEIASSILTEAGCLIDIAKGGQESVEMSTSNSYDMILMDIQMPDVDGLLAARIIHEKLKNSTPPIIAMTAYSMEGDENKFINLGFDDYIAKPIRPENFIEKLQSYFGNISDKTASKTLPQDEDENQGDLSVLKTINHEVLDKLRSYGGNEMVVTALQEFDEESTQQILESNKAFKKNNIQLILTELHTLKGNAGTLGVEKMAFQARKVEKYLKMKKYDTFEEEMNLLKELHENFKNELKALINLN